MGSKRKVAGALGGAVLMAAGSTAFQTSYRAEVVRVLDGDTIEVQVELLPGLQQTIQIREGNLDTPEKRRGGRGGAQCDEELAAGKAVSELVRSKLPAGTIVGVENVSLGKYAGRAIGDIKLNVDGKIVDLGDWLIGLGKAVPYDGGTKSKVWCPLGDVAPGDQ